MKKFLSVLLVLCLLAAASTAVFAEYCEVSVDPSALVEELGYGECWVVNIPDELAVSAQDDGTISGKINISVTDARLMDGVALEVYVYSGNGYEGMDPKFLLMDEDGLSTVEYTLATVDGTLMDQNSYIFTVEGQGLFTNEYLSGSATLIATVDKAELNANWHGGALTDTLTFCVDRIDSYGWY